MDQSYPAFIDKGESEALKRLSKIVGNAIPLVNDITKEPFGVEVVSGHVVAISLPNVLFSSFPDEIFQFSRLQTLYLMNNQIKSIPKKISLLKELRILGSWGNYLTTLPETIGELPLLENLLLPENRISSLPESLGNLKTLKVLGLWKNHFRKIPSCIRSIESLVDLQLKENSIEEIPPWIADLKNLKILNLDNNDISYVPYAITGVKNLESLILSNNPLVDLPPLEGLINLRNLNLEGTKLSYLDLEGLSSLETLNVNDTPLDLIVGLENLNSLTRFSASGTKISEFALYPSNLKAIDLSWNELQEVPTSILNLNELRILDLSSNNLTSLPSGFAKLKSLTTIDLSDNSIEDLSYVSDLVHLEKLSLKGNNLRKFPSSLVKLPWLRELDLSYNPIESIPPEIGNFKSLSILRMRKTNISSIPFEIVHLKNLQTLDLSFTPFQPFEECFEKREDIIHGLFYILFDEELVDEIIFGEDNQIEKEMIRNKLRTIFEDLGKGDLLPPISQIWETLISQDIPAANQSTMIIFGKVVAETNYYLTKLIKDELESLNDETSINNLKKRIWKKLENLIDIEELVYIFEEEFYRNFRNLLEREVQHHPERLLLKKDMGIIDVLNENVAASPSNSIVLPKFACRYCGFAMEEGEIVCKRCWKPSICGKCKTKLPIGSLTCENCSNEIIHPSCGLIVPAGLIKCDACGDEIKYCYRCSMPIHQNILFCTHCQERVGFCSICRQPFMNLERISSCPVCQSPFHFGHFYEAIKHSGKCPICRSSILLEEIKEKFWK